VDNYLGVPRISFEKKRGHEMAINNAKPVGTGQQGAGMPAGINQDTPIHTEGKHVDKMDKVANRAAKKGIEREHREDPTPFTK
jgi:hypothetical protein